jgi:hypothetical protein
MEGKPKFKPDSGLRLMDQVRQVLGYYHYAYRTEQTYCDWIVRFIRFHGSKRHPKDMGRSEVEAFLSHLASDGKVSASTQRQALNAIVFSIGMSWKKRFRARLWGWGSPILNCELILFASLTLALPNRDARGLSPEIPQKGK